MVTRKAIWFGFCAFLLLAWCPVHGQKIDDELNRSERPTRKESRLQVGIGGNFRIDNPDKQSYVPSVAARMYYFFHPIVAVRTGLEYNALTRLGNEFHYHTLALSIGLRINAREKYLIPFLEGGLWLPLHWGTSRGTGYTDFQPGLRFAAGLSIGISRKVALDFCVAQIFNHIETPRTSFAPPPGASTYPPLTAGDSHRAFLEPEEIYNPATAEFVVRIGW